MTVDQAGELGVAALERLDVDELLEQLGGLRAGDVAAEQLAVLPVARITFFGSGAAPSADSSSRRPDWGCSWAPRSKLGLARSAGPTKAPHNASRFSRTGPSDYRPGGVSGTSVILASWRSTPWAT